MEKQKTAMQELIEYLDPIHEGIKLKATQLLEKEREQIIDAFSEGASDGYWGEGSSNKEKYYNETYGSKGSDKKKINLVEIPQEQLEEERNTNYKYFDIDDTSSQTEISAEQFCETYGSKGSDEEKTNSQRFDEFMDLVKSSQTEISDEEIDKEAKTYINETTYFKEGFTFGAKWYREQLKQRQ